MRSDIARTAFGVDGTGVMVGTLSDSYNCRGGAAAGVASGDLPAGVLVLNEGPCPATDEGQAMMEIVQAFHTAFGGQASFAQGIVDLADAGASVINDDAFYLDEPFFQDGIIAQAVDLGKARGISYCSAAGNDGRQSYESPFRGSRQFIDLGAGGEELHDFDPGTGVDTCPRSPSRWATRWTKSSNGTSPSSRSAARRARRATWTSFSPTGPVPRALLEVLTSTSEGIPFEFFSFGNAGPDTTFGIIILHFTGPNPGVMKTVNVGSGSITTDQFDTKTGSSGGHSAALGGLGVGAARYQNTPVFGIDPPLIEGFSSAGGTPIVFDTAGNRLATPEVRQQPDITAPDGGDTTFFIPGVDPDVTGFPNFFGTSAAAPHAAGVAALMKALVPSLTPDSTYAVLKTTAIDMDDPSTGGFDTGFDFGTGFGLIQADAALNEIAIAPEPIPPVVPPVQPVPPVGPQSQPPAPPPGRPVLPPVGPVVPVAPRADVLCRGRSATIVGTEGDDIIVGTPGPDVIHGLGGNDFIFGALGSDVICGGSGNDSISGGRGRDRLFGDYGTDRLNGGKGRDRCVGGAVGRYQRQV